MACLEPFQQDLEQIDLPWADSPLITPPLLIHTITTRAAKIWPLDRWNRVLEWCNSQGHQVGLLGAPPKRQHSDYHAGDGEEKLREWHPTTLIDMRGQTNLIQLAGACKKAMAVVSVDAGPLHVAAAVGTPTLAVVGNDQNSIGASPIRLWQPRIPMVERTVTVATCTLCSDNLIRNDGCIAEEHLCMQGIRADEVIYWLKKRLG
jgi:ADP-heptose:LPS heptosyltransferase